MKAEQKTRYKGATPVYREIREKMPQRELDSA